MPRAERRRATAASGSASGHDGRRGGPGASSRPSGLRRRLEPLRADLDRRAVVRLQQRPCGTTAGRPWSMRSSRFSKLPSDFDIFSPLGVDHEGVVHPVVGEALAEGDGLGPLVLVVRELEVEAAAVEVEPLAEEVERHHDALGVPARAAVAPRRRPRRLAGLGQLPEREVGRVALAARRRTTSRSPPPASMSSSDWLGEQAVVRRPTATLEVDAVVGGVGLADRRRARRSASTISSTHSVAWGTSVGRSTPMRVHGLATRPPRSGRRSRPASRPSRVGPLDDLVVDVGDVRHEPHARAAPLEVAAQDVVDERGPAVAEVRRAVDGGPAQVDAHLAGLALGELHGPRPVAVS